MENKGVKLLVVSSSSAGNSYALDAGNEILLLEAGVKHATVTKAIGFRDELVVGCLTSHVHGDHAKYVEEYSKRGTLIVCNRDVAEKKKLEMGRRHIFEKPFETFSVGSFRVCPFPLSHDVPCSGFIIHHPDCGAILFALDTYKMDFFIEDVDHFLIEANYDDRILKANVEDGKIDRHQANRLMLSHMSLDNTVHFLHECHAERAKNIILCHLSERNSDPDMFRDRVAREFGVPTYIASKNLVVNLNKEVI